MNSDYNAGDGDLSVLRRRQSVDEEDCVCCNPDSLQILNQVHNLFADRVKTVDEDASLSEDKRLEIKYQIMCKWVKDLSEQNEMLVSTVQNLEQTAATKVKQLEKKLAEPYCFPNGKMMDYERLTEELLTLSQRINQLEMVEKNYQAKIDRLESDNKNLLKAIRQAYFKNNWNFDDLHFYEISPSEILNVSEYSSSQDARESCNELNYNMSAQQENQLNCLEHSGDNVTILHKKLHEQERCIEYLSKNIFTIQRKLSMDDIESDEIDYKSDCESIMEKMNCIFAKIDLDTVIKSKLEEKDKLIKNLENRLAEQEKESKESREALTTEVAMSHDKICKQRKELMDFEDRFRTQSSQLKLKDEQIRNLRREKVELEEICRKSGITLENSFKEKNSVKFSCPVRKVRICSNVEENKECDSSSSSKLSGNNQEKHISPTTEQREKSTNEPISQQVHSALRQQYQLMEEFRMCTVEAQAATEDLREETESVISNLNHRHHKYKDIHSTVHQVLDFLNKAKQNMSPMMSRVKLQEDESERHETRIHRNKDRLKSLKNSINQVRSELSQCLNNIQGNVETYGFDQFSKTQICCDLLNEVDEEIDQLVCSFSVQESQNETVMKILTDLKEQLSTVEYTLQSLHTKSDEVFQENRIAQDVYLQREKKLKKLEEELDCSHTKMQNVLENFKDRGEKMHELMFDEITEIPVECLKSTINCGQLKYDFQRLKKDYEDLKVKFVEEESKAKEYDSMNTLGSRLMECEDQIMALRYELVGKQESNNILKINIKSLEKELLSERAKAESHRKISSAVNIDYKRKVIELEKVIEVQKSLESELRKTLESNEVEIKKSRETLADLQTQLSMKGNDQELQSNQESIHLSIKTLTDTIQSERNVLLDLVNVFKNVRLEETSNPPLTTVMQFIDTIGKCNNNIEHCFEEITELKNDVSKKEKLLNDKEEIIRVQKDSIAVLKSDFHDIQKKYESEVENKEIIIAQCKEENKKLTKQIELQAQTIGHLRDAVVEAKRCMDQMGHKAVSDSIEEKQIIRSLRLVLDETQRQYKDCFNEVIKQDKLLELYRNAVDSLRAKIKTIKCYEFVLFVIIYLVYYFSTCSLQDQLNSSINDCQQLQQEVVVIKETKSHMESKVKTLNSLCRQKNEELMELKRVLFRRPAKNQFTQVEQKSIKDSETLTDVREFQEKSTSTLENESDDDKFLEYKIHLNRIEEALNSGMDKLDLLRDEVSRKNSCITSVESQTDISIVKSLLESNYNTEDLRDKLLKSEKHEYILLNKIRVLENELKGCSVKFAGLKADYQVLQNDFSILKKDLFETETKANAEIREWKNKEKHFYLSMQMAKEEEDKVRQEIERLQLEIDTKTTKINELQSSQNDDIYYMKQYIEKIEEENGNLRVQLKKYKDDNSILQKQVELLESNNSKYMTELELLQKSAAELQKENQSKSSSLDKILADYSQRLIYRTKLCNESERIMTRIREWLEGQYKQIEDLILQLKKKDNIIERIVCEKELLAFNYKRLKVTKDDLVQKLKRYQRLFGRNTKKRPSHKCVYLKPVYGYPNLKKRGCMSKINKTSSDGHSWIIPRLKYVSENLRQLDRYYSFLSVQDDYFCEDEILSQTESQDDNYTNTVDL